MPNLDKLKKRLRPAIDRSTKKELKKVRKKYEKEKEKRMGKKKDDEVKRVVMENPLDDVIDLKKKKVFSNELDSVLEQQKKEKTGKKKEVEEGEQPEKQSNGMMEAMLGLMSSDKMKDVSEDSLVKMFTALGAGGGGGQSVDPLTAALLGGNKKEEGIVELVQAMQMMKEMNDNGGNGGNMQMMMMMMVMMFKLMNQNQPQPKPEPKQDNTVELMKLMLQNQQNNGNSTEKKLLMDKIKELEYRVSSSDPVDSLMRMMDKFKNMRSVFDGPSSPEDRKLQLELEKMKMDQQKEIQKEEARNRRMETLTNMFSEGISKFGEAFAGPAANALKNQVNQAGVPNARGLDNQQMESTQKDINELMQELDGQNIPNPPQSASPRSQHQKSTNQRLHVKTSEDDL